MMLSNTLHASLHRHDISIGFSCGELDGLCSFSILCRQLQAIAQSPIYIAEFGALSGSGWLQSSMIFGSRN